MLLENYCYTKINFCPREKTGIMIMCSEGTSPMLQIAADVVVEGGRKREGMVAEAVDEGDMKYETVLLACLNHKERK